jgi:hypothetical protein
LSTARPRTAGCFNSRLFFACIRPYLSMSIAGLSLKLAHAQLLLSQALIQKMLWTGSTPKMASAMRKLYCYVDESGQDTFAQPNRRHIFVVGVVIANQNRDALSRACERYEQISGKGKFKWNSAERTRRLHYMHLILHDKRFRQVLRFSSFHHITKKDFDASTVKGIAWAALLSAPSPPFVIQVRVDGLAKKKRSEYRQGLKRMGEVKGVPREKSSPLTRLADALAGMVRDADLGEDADAKELLGGAVAEGLIVGEWL